MNSTMSREEWIRRAMVAARFSASKPESDQSEDAKSPAPQAGAREVTSEPVDGQIDPGQIGD